MTVGVIVTVYNLEQYVKEALMSVVNQHLKPDRTIVIDDGSTDNSREVIQEFRTIFELVTNPVNQGVLPSVITGIKMLDTDVVALLDGDDVWEPNKLFDVMDTFNKDDSIMMVLHNFKRINKDGVLIPGVDITQRNLDRINKLSEKMDQDELLKDSILSYRGVWLGSALSFKRSTLNVEEFEHWSLNFWGHEYSHQDQPLAAYLIANNPKDRIRYIHQELFRYRIYGENSSGSSTTLPKALKTLQRSKATLIRTHSIVKQLGNRQDSLQRQEMKLLEVTYLEALYNNHWATAFKLFVSLFYEFWTMKDRIKEIGRFGGVLILGPTRFLKLK